MASTRFSAALLTLSFLALSCQESVNLDLPSDLGEKAVAADGVRHPGILPAHKLPWEDRVPGKMDAASDYRKAHPEWYVITEPPASADFRPMKEWEPMKAMLMTLSDYLPSDTKTMKTFVDIVVGALPYGEVWIIYSLDSNKTNLIAKLADAGVSQADIDEKVKWFFMDNDAIWTIDYGPLPLVDNTTNTVAFGDFRYYHERYLDDAVPTRLANALGGSTYRAPFDYEGGNFQADGDQYCYFSERVYEYTAMSYDDVDSVMKDYFGCKKAVVLKDITNDGTGHIDMFFKLGGKHTAIVGEYTVVVDNVNEQRMDDNVAILESLVYDDDPTGITVYRLPMPNAGTSGAEKIPRTYINSTLFTNAEGTAGVNLWPMYTVDKDLEAQALAVWEQALPHFDHVGIVSDQISLYSGAVHCITRTIPALPLAKWVPDGTCVDGMCTGGGYDGACISIASETPGCWGPKWACLCNVCEDTGCQIPSTCGNNSCDELEGCFTCPQDCPCENGTECNPGANKCVPATCGNGTCEPEENCGLCAKDCKCASGEKCTFGICTTDPCGDIDEVGCCDGNAAVYCDSGALVVADCGTSKCGWIANRQWYDCTGSATADPAGTYPRECKGNYDYPPGCDGKVCGDNGGGYSCGTCPEGSVCEEGQCVGGECVCGEKECGDNGCGGSCGTCAEGKVCSAEGKCEDPCEPQCEGKQCGDDGCGTLCGTCPEGKECDEAGACVDPCVPNCGTATCGDNGCGGSCGDCGEGQECKDGTCKDICVPACGDKTCGDDGCGGNCGTCGDGQECSTEGTCQDACVPQCDGKTCGDNGCGGTCGTCGKDETCSDEGVCESPSDDSGSCSASPVTSGGSAGSALLLLAGLAAMFVVRRRAASIPVR